MTELPELRIGQWWLTENQRNRVRLTNEHRNAGDAHYIFGTLYRGVEVHEMVRWNRVRSLSPANTYWYSRPGSTEYCLVQLLFCPTWQGAPGLVLPRDYPA